MSGIVLVVLQIFLLLLKAHFNKNSDSEKAIEAIRQAQGKLSDLASDFETKIRFEAPTQDQVDRVQDMLDEERKKFETNHNQS